MSDRWVRGDVDLGQVWLGPDGRVWRVLSIADEPTVELRELATGVAANHVISSRNFAEYRLLQPRRAGDR